MGRRTRIAALMTMCWLSAVGIRPAGSQAAHDLRGVWKLVSYTRDGEPQQIDAFMFITARHFSRTIMERDRPKFGFDFRKVDALTAEQARIVAAMYPRSNSDAGPYRVAGDTFYFTTAVHQSPDSVGNEARRSIEWRDGRLRLYGQAGSGYVDELWERVEEVR